MKPVEFRESAGGGIHPSRVRTQAQDPVLWSRARRPARLLPGARSPRPRRGENDIAAVRMVARGRVLLATAVVIAASILLSPGEDGDLLLYTLGVWVAWSGWLAIEADTRPPRFTQLAGAGADLVVLLAVAHFPDAGAVVRLGCVMIVLMGAYLGGAGEGAVLAVLATAISATTPDTSAVLTGLFAVVLVMLLGVVERGTSQQRSASRQSQRLLGRSGAILERVADGVLVTDGQGMLLEANPAAHRISGRRPGDLVARHCNEVIPLGRGERRLDCSAGCALLKMGGSVDDPGDEVWCLMPDGRRRPLLANACAITNPDGGVDEVVHSLRDITSLKQADEAKTLFLATTSHELKTPLTVIRGFGEMLVEGPDLPVETRVRAADAIVRRADELAVIVDGLLISSRIEAGRLNLEVRPVEVAHILHERGRSLAAATGREVDLHVAGLPEVEADVAAVTTLVDHLLDNAVKYSPVGGPVTLAASAADGVVRIAVTDTGVGMDEDQAAHCFDKFWQAEAGDDRRFKGSGIGLYIVRSLAEAMGGMMLVDSVPGVGSTFTLVLRVAEKHEGPGPAAAGQDRGVGDESIVREFMRQLGIREEGPWG